MERRLELGSSPRRNKEQQNDEMEDGDILFIIITNVHCLNAIQRPLLY